MTIVTSSYDAVPYTSLPYPRTHPDHLHAMARIFGVRAPEVDSCRVVELGCGSAGNLLAMAATLPRARFVGIDSSAGEIARGRAVVEALGLPNLDLVVGDAAAALPGEFDYVIAHGLLSWVPPDTRRAILSRAREALSPNGVVYASYNVNPGFQLRAAVRGMLRYQSREVASARRLLDWLSRRVARDGSGYRAVLDEEQERLAAADDGYLFHEHLEDHNHALWFHELASEARSLGLQWLAEADPAATVRALGNPRAYAALREIAGDDPIAIEQHFDFMRGRSFRASLLVSETHQRREVVPDGDLFVASAGSSDVEESELLRTLAGAWPDGVRVSEVDAAEIPALHAAGVVELRTRPLHLVSNRSLTLPAAGMWTSPYARYQALRAGPVTNLRHEPIPLAEAERRLLSLLDDRFEPSLLGPEFPLEVTLSTLARLAFLRDGPP